MKAALFFACAAAPLIAQQSGAPLPAASGPPPHSPLTFNAALPCRNSDLVSDAAAFFRDHKVPKGNGWGTALQVEATDRLTFRLGETRTKNGFGPTDRGIALGFDIKLGPKRTASSAPARKASLPAAPE